MFDYGITLSITIAHTFLKLKCHTDMSHTATAFVAASFER